MTRIREEEVFDCNYVSRTVCEILSVKRRYLKVWVRGHWK